MLQTYRLGNYVEALLSHGGNPQGVSRPFNNAAATHPPLLRTRGPNRILLYPGSFNPPHKGHFDLLNYVFQEAGDDLNIVAAIILPTDDGHLTAKTRNEQNPLVLEKEKRAKLWTAHGLADWAWVFDKSVEEWCGLRAQLEKAVKRDGVDLKFMLLAGPDCVSADAMCIPLYWNCTEVITSDVSRSVDFRYSQTLRQFSSYFQWEKPHYEVSKVESLIHVKDAVEQSIAKIKAVWVCHRVRKPKGMIRFVPCNVEQENPPSSTQIRRLINNHYGDDLKKELEGLALSPSVLAGYVHERKRTTDS